MSDDVVADDTTGRAAWASADDADADAAVTVIVVSWNTCELLDRCLRSLWSDVREGRARVCVVDNGSTDG
jgi:hypothetical protein